MTDMAKVGRITKAEKQWHVTHTMKESALLPLVCPLLLAASLEALLVL